MSNVIMACVLCCGCLISNHSKISLEVLKNAAERVTSEQVAQMSGVNVHSSGGDMVKRILDSHNLALAYSTRENGDEVLVFCLDDDCNEYSVINKNK